MGSESIGAFNNNESVIVKVGPLQTKAANVHVNQGFKESLQGTFRDV